MVDTLSSYCAEAGEPDDAAMEEARRHVLDWLGLVPGGREHATSSPVILDAVRAIAGTDIPGGVPTGTVLGADRAAFLAGSFAHSLDFDDTHRESSLHPGAPVIAAALAVAREVEATGEAFLAAVSLGYDVTCALGRAVDPANHYDRGFHLTATCGTFGATAAVGHLRGFEAATFESAFGINGSQAAGSMQFLENGAWNKRIHPGLAASRAVVAGRLAAAGFRGSADPIEGTRGFLASYSDAPHPDLLEDITPGAAIRETALKPYPCCRYLHGAIDGLSDLADDVDAAAIESVTIDLPEPGRRITGAPIDRKRRPANFVDCQFSAPFAAALVLSTGTAGLAAFQEAQGNLDDPALHGLMDRVDVISTERTNDPYPARWPAHVVVEADGRVDRFVDHPRGEPENPLSWDEIESKFRDLVRQTPIGAASNDVVEAVGNLGTQTGTDTDALVTALDGS